MDLSKIVSPEEPIGLSLCELRTDIKRKKEKATGFACFCGGGGGVQEVLSAHTTLSRVNTCKLGSVQAGTCSVCCLHGS